MASAAEALREELSVVKDHLDLYTRAGEKNPGDLAGVVAPLKQIGSTLTLLGFERSKEIVASQLKTLGDLAIDEQVDQQTLLNIASALVQVDEDLAGFTTDGNKPEIEKIAGDAQKSVAMEARAGLDEAKTAVVDYISSEWDVEHLVAASDRQAPARHTSRVPRRTPASHWA